MSSTGVSSPPGTDVGTEDGARRRSVNPEQIRDDLIDAAAAYAPEIGDLIRLYYRHIPAEEILGDDPVDLVGAVRSHLQLAKDRMPGRPAVRLLNPTGPEDGWTREATVVQVVTDDMPYLVDSVAAEFARDGVQVQRIVHPIVVVSRDLTGELLAVHPDADPAEPPSNSAAESWMYIEIDLVTDPNRARELDNRLSSVLGDVREVVEDTDKMAEQARRLADELDENPPNLPTGEVAEGARLLRWLADGHFTFLGYRRYELIDNPHPGNDEPALRAVLATGLGVLRQDSLAARSLTAGPDTAVSALAPTLLVLTQASAPSTVHRPVYPYYVGVKTFDDNGNVTGEHRFLGMFTTTALHENVLDIPVVCNRVREVIHRAGFPMESFSGQRMLEVLQNWPRADLFSADTDSLYSTTTGAITLSDRRRLRLFLRRDPYGRFYSCLVYLPRDRYTTRSRLAMQEVLLEELEGTQLEYSARIGETVLAQVHFIVHTDPSQRSEPDTLRIQERLNEAVRSWDDRMVEAILAERRERAGDSGVAIGLLGEESAGEQGQRFAAVFPEGYKEDFSALEALADLRALESLTDEGDLSMSFYLPADAEAGERRFKLYLRGEGVTLSKVLPVLQRMGVEVVDERPYELRREDGGRSWIYDFGLRIDPQVLDHADTDLRVRFQDAFHAAWRGDCEVDGFNGLVLRAGLTWRQAAILRAYSRYLRQTKIPFSQEYIENTVLAHTDIATALVRLFETRFDLSISAEARASQADQLTAEIGELVDEVTSLDEDRILRRLMAVILATLRTNYHVTDAEGSPRQYLALKLDPSAVPELPEPRPKYEIFVYSPRVEGVHLRFGDVARGGLRWSDRREDFRTEILGLVKAQAVKNAVIVPVGAKGGFVVKRPPTATGDPGLDRDAQLNEGIACYRMFISGLLDVTDNRVEGKTVPAPGVVRHDGDDSYLVVAADKGTAKFSDIANEVSANYGFWLGDAFASGGSVGYDHKAMGITAKGAWESVKRHFRELGKDTQTEDFTVVGIGDMMGDVFGNGMLLSEHIRLVAAFNHLHIFLDPNPDSATSFAERRRLFDLPRSSWEDYDRSLISEGGGVYSRSAKTIPISPQVREALGLGEDVTKLAPNDLMQAILLAPVELLWNGGIGTYVKAENETHADAGDKANDALRVNGNQLRVRVVGEGGNLGLTQLGRIEFARAGGKINTDALDNSAGVDCSDHEVNIKILLDHLVSTGSLGAEQRNELLELMTDEVGELVLADNYRQNAVLGVSRAHAGPMVSVHQRLVAALVAKGAFDRKLEALPSSAEFRALEKANEGLTSPELATLMAHVKLDLKDELLASELPDSEVFSRRLPEYFPKPLREQFGEAIFQHPLKREIITTMVANEVVDGAGISYVFRLMEEMNATATDAVRAYAVVTQVYDLPSLWAQIDALDNVVPTEVADEMMLETRRLLDRAARWFLTNRPQPLAPLAEINRFGRVVGELAPRAHELLRGVECASVDDNAERLVQHGVPAELAQRVALLLHTFGLLDVTDVAEMAEQQVGIDAVHSPAETAALYYALSDHLSVDKMLTSISGLERGNRWHALARLALRDDVYGSLRAITLDALRHSDSGTDPDEKIAHWEKTNASRLQRARVALDEIGKSGKLDLATLSVAARQIRSTVR
ncbi:NAD-glutamate dehydrogenase [Amycolatopsis regifaucium]|uniref:NAD-glutamate dehydrogenase n=1 Tax=Amycolatopsis regifaucium TaxID=546365 RepID=A0A154MIA3_9PSEU|nr:NAD-glutamate dehydrogenase [Amycolatopsis regifaucium]KZB84102.1 NAD-glutamate dehydrogenase [Amycolatopsis regifaucium]OKA08592.1 NAD-glutamate dehydrogenase [Amycolatopsis regifaucium]SFJ55168.1 glutamate dehydrogenase [Amycolatopsis regifaucium]